MHVHHLLIEFFQKKIFCYVGKEEKILVTFPFSGELLDTLEIQLGRINSDRQLERLLNVMMLLRKNLKMDMEPEENMKPILEKMANISEISTVDLCGEFLKDSSGGVNFGARKGL